MPADTTKRRIKTKVLEFLKTKSIDSIKATDITRALGISRGTFYRHYDSVYSVLQEIEDSFFEEYSTLASDFLNYRLSRQYLNIPHPALMKDLEYLQKHADLLLTLFGPNGDIRFQARCSQLTGEYMLTKREQHNLADSQSKLVRTYLSRGLMYMTIEWLKGDSDISKEEFAKTIYKMSFGMHERAL